MIDAIGDIGVSLFAKNASKETQVVVAIVTIFCVIIVLPVVLVVSFI